jgi:hypothetical protein
MLVHGLLIKPLQQLLLLVDDLLAGRLVNESCELSKLSGRAMYERNSLMQSADLRESPQLS